MRRIAIIPARGGSKRIPNKNIKSFCGKPMISYILNTVKKSKLFDVIHVSTDSDEIKRVVEDLGFPVDFMRNNQLSDDFTPIMPVLKWVIESYRERGLNFDEVAAVMPCAAFIDSDDLKSASNAFKKDNYKYPILSVSTFQAPIEWAFRLEDGNMLIPLDKEMIEKRSQDLEEYYFDSGSFAFFSSDYIFNSSGAGIDNSYIGFVIDKYKAIDIDNLDDWVYAEYLMYGLKFSKIND